eukprot:jgi/Hompol1/1765/HPOL_005709-RA
MSHDVSTISFFVFAGIGLITHSIAAGAIADQGEVKGQYLTYCLLFLNFDDVAALRTSSACNSFIYATVAAILVLLLLTLTHLYFAFKKHTPPRYLTLATAVLASIFAIISLAFASLATDGLAKSCSAFTTSVPSIDCSTAFSSGLFRVTQNEQILKNYTTLKAAVACAWIAVGSWIAVAGMSWIKYLRTREFRDTENK